MIERAGLYVHVPFCARICPYCDFAVRTGTARSRAAYVESLLGEIALCGELKQWDFETLYFGGGTPSMLDSQQLSRILQALPDGWIFLEANPEDVTLENVAAWRALGIRTLSIGVQSFDDASLRFLGRQHDGAAARRSAEIALSAGFETVSLDLIYGLPDQTQQAWRQQLETAIELAPQHLSCYQLDLLEGTPMARQKLTELPDDAQADRFELTHELLAEAGLTPYEVCSFARAPAHQSRHNSKYWHHTPYLGLGPSAHSFDGRRRWWNARKLPDYKECIANGQLPRSGEETLGPEALQLEALMLGLRTVAGIALRRFDGLIQRNAALIERGVADGQIVLDDDHLRLTTRGLAIADGLAAAFEL